MGKWFMVFQRILFNGQAVEEDCLTPKNQGTMILPNMGHHSPNNTASHHRRLEFIARRYFQADQARASWIMMKISFSAWSTKSTIVSHAFSFHYMLQAQYVKDKAAMKAYKESGAIAAIILNLGIRWGWVVSSMRWPLYLWGKNPWYLLNRRLGAPQSWSGCFGEKKITPPSENWNPEPPAHILYSDYKQNIRWEKRVLYIIKPRNSVLYKLCTHSDNEKRNRI